MANSIDILQEENAKLKKEIEELKKELTKKDDDDKLMHRISCDYSDKFNICKDMLNFFRIYIPSVSGGIFGSFMRQLFELPFMLQNAGNLGAIENRGFGNPINHDLDIVISIKKNQDIVLELIQCMKIINYITMRCKTENINKLYFGNYYVDDISDVSIKEINKDSPEGKINLVGIPHYQLKLCNKDNNKQYIMVDIMGWLPNYTFDFDINTMIMTEQYIFSPENIFDIIENIRDKTASVRYDIATVHKQFLDSQVKSESITKLKQLSYFMGNRMKILTHGYNKILGNIPNTFVEYTDDCIITGFSPPYIAYELVCGHKFSVISLMMSMNKTAEQFDFKCYLCRQAFIIKFINKQEVIPDKIYYGKQCINIDESVSECENKQIPNEDNIIDISLINDETALVLKQLSHDFLFSSQEIRQGRIDNEPPSFVP